jgi:predicted transcriptional regulator
MRTTVDIPDQLSAQLRAIARDTNRTLSAVLADLVRRGMEPRGRVRIIKGKSGLPMFAAVGRAITQEDVRALEDDE